MIPHPYNIDHACLSCAYPDCPCKSVPLTCVTCGTQFPPRGYNGIALDYCTSACDPDAATRWTRSPFADHSWPEGGCKACDKPDYLHPSPVFFVDRIEAAALELGQRPDELPYGLALALRGIGRARAVTKNSVNGRLHLRRPTDDGSYTANPACDAEVSFSVLARVPTWAEPEDVCEVCWPREG